MTILKVYGKLKSSIDDFKKALSKLISYTPSLDTTNDLDFKCNIVIDSIADYDVIDVVRFLVKHCSNFEIGVDETNYYEIDRSSYSKRSIYYHWDGKNLMKCYRDYFGSSCEDVNFLLD